MSRSAAVLPYRVLPPDAVKPAAEGWRVIVEGQQIAAITDGGALSQWDPNLVFELRRSFDVDIRTATFLGVEYKAPCLELAVVTSWAGGLARTLAFRQALPTDTAATIEVVVTPPTSDLARQLVLTSGVYLAKDIKVGDAIAPRLCGSRLWETTDGIRLEGGAARLPIYEVPFSRVFMGEQIDNADFHVEVADDVDLEVELALTVYLNSERPDFIGEVRRPGSAAERQLWTGIIRRVLSTQAVVEGLSETGAAVSGALIEAARRWSSQIWRGGPAKHLGEQLGTRHALFEAQIESWVNTHHAGPKPGGAA